MTLAEKIKALPLPPSPAEVGDLVLKTREHVQSLGWRNREPLYPASQVRTLLDAAASLAAEQEAMVQQMVEAMERLAKRGTHYDTCPTRIINPSEAATKIDQWWLCYFQSADNYVREVAEAALRAHKEQSK